MSPKADVITAWGKSVWGTGGIVSRHGRFALRKRAFGNHWIPDWVGHTVRVDAFKNRKFLPIARNKISVAQLSSPNLDAVLTELVRRLVYSMYLLFGTLNTWVF